MHSTMQDDGIAVFYSYPSTFATKLEEGKSYGKYEDAHTAVVKFIRNSGFQFRYVTDRMLRIGEFDTSKYKILFLPRAEAIGDSEAQIIRKFVENGGTVVTDFRPGIYDDHCKPRTRGVLDGLFGINRLARTTARSADIPTGSSTVTVLVDDGVVLADAAAMQQVRGATPVFTSRQFGKGRAIFLNSGMSCLGPLLSAQETVERGGASAPTAVHRTGFWGFEPVIKLNGVDGKPPENADITRWRNGGMDIVSIFRQGGKQEEITVSLPSTGFVYDLRGSRALGACERFTTTIVPNRASFFVLTNKPAPAPGIRLEKTAVTQGTVVKAAVFVPGAEGLHAVKIRVEVGERHLDWFDRDLIVGQDPAQVEIPVAFNDPVGDYRIIVSDLFSNGTSETNLKVN
ncbi:MAG: beta-galactosidase trimerization domain-containing protein [Syntrophobacteraceae bacterium]